jgi:hypothetical protein
VPTVVNLEKIKSSKMVLALEFFFNFSNFFQARTSLLSDNGLENN